MSIIHVNHIKTYLGKYVSPNIDMADCAAFPAEQKDDVLLSRSLAAYALCIVAGMTPDVAAKHVTDGYDDQGIDAIFYDEPERRLIVVQSKWIHSGDGSPDLGSVLKMLEGFGKLLEPDLAPFNAKVKALSAEVQHAIEDSGSKFVLVLAYPGQQGLSKEAKDAISNRLSDLNDPTEMVSLRVLEQRELHLAISGVAEGAPIDFDVMMSEWGQVRDPFSAYTGMVSASDVAAWYESAGERLFTKNLRKVIAHSAINDALAETLKTHPERFWYFNNGITALCQSVEKKPLGGPDRAKGVFECKGVSVVNGAQTVGSIHAAFRSNPDTVKNASVSVRFISLAACPPEFAVEVTKATNTQNRIESRDFAALDPEQDRIRMEMLLEGRDYRYKTGDLPPPPDKGCTIDEATIALACAREVGLAVIAKSAVGRLWDNIEKPPYKLLFNGSITGQRVWRTVDLLRSIDATLALEAAKKSGKQRTTAIHGNRFIAHQVFKRVPLADIDKVDFDLELAKQMARSMTPKLLTHVVDAVNALYPNSYVQSLFKNAGRCKAIDQKLASVNVANA